jgi:hypothetical protein
MFVPAICKKSGLTNKYFLKMREKETDIYARNAMASLSNNYDGEGFDDLDGEGFDDLDGEGFDDLDGEGFDDLDGEGFDDFDEGYDDYVSHAKSVEKFDIKVENRTGSEKTIVLVPGSIDVSRPVAPDTNNHIVLIGGGALTEAVGTLPYVRNDNPQGFAPFRKADAVVMDGRIYGENDTKVINASASKGIPIAVFHEFTKRNPCKIRKIQISANDREMFDNGKLIFKTLSPFNQTGDINISLSDYLNPNQLNDKKIIVDCLATSLNISLDDQTVVYLVMPGEANGVALMTANIQFEMDVYNQAGAIYSNRFRKKARKVARPRPAARPVARPRPAARPRPVTRPVPKRR